MENAGLLPQRHLLSPSLKPSPAAAEVQTSAKVSPNYVNRPIQSLPLRSQGMVCNLGFDAHAFLDEEEDRREGLKWMIVAKRHM